MRDETLDRRRAYESDVLGAFKRLGARRGPGLAEEERAREQRLRAGLHAAIAGLDAAIAQVNADSLVARIRDGALADFVHDEVMSDLVWDEKLNALIRERA
jgi:hypothetical protein